MPDRVCCGLFCLPVSIVAAGLMFVFYGLLNHGTQRIEIDGDHEEQQKYAMNALGTAIVYLVFALLSVCCIFSGKNNSGYQRQIDDPEEHEPLFRNNDDVIQYDATKGNAVSGDDLQ